MFIPFLGLAAMKQMPKNARQRRESGWRGLDGYAKGWPRLACTRGRSRSSGWPTSTSSTHLNLAPMRTWMAVGPWGDVSGPAAHWACVYGRGLLRGADYVADVLLAAGAVAPLKTRRPFEGRAYHDIDKRAFGRATYLRLIVVLGAPDRAFTVSDPSQAFSLQRAFADDFIRQGGRREDHVAAATALERKMSARRCW